MDEKALPGKSSFDAVIAAIDAANDADPRREAALSGNPGVELVYGRRMSEMCASFVPDASEALQLAVRAQHLERWIIPRSDFPQGRGGYHRWRNTLKEHHAARAGEILANNGYGPPMIARVQALIRKEDLKRDAEAQALEDVACLVFLAHYLPAFAARQTEDKVIGILRRTWSKMSEPGRTAALALPLGRAERTLVERALAGDKND